jgi:ribose transport system ATP-binding protein
VTVVLTELAKSYGAVKALRGVSLTIEPGSVHALLGPNGAGKSTLIACMSGATRPDSGEIAIDGERHARLGPAEARRAGISVIYQKFSLVDALSVGDNVFLGSELTRCGLRRRREQRRQAERLLARLRRPVPVRARVGSLPIADRQVVEIAKALRHESRVLVFDEPTASLSAHEARALLGQVRELKAEGMHVLYVTHRLDEVLELADHVTVLRDGAVALSRPVAELSRADLVAAIADVAKADEPPPPPPARPASGTPLLRLDDVSADRVGPLSLTLAAGEVVGVFGLLGSGRTELLETIFGLRRPLAGAVELDGKRARGGPAARIRAGIALVPAERVRQSLFMSMPARDNLLLPTYRALGRRVTGLRRRGAEARLFGETAAALALTPAKASAPASAFSGGNQQKLAIGRWLNARRGTRLLLLDEPTQGIDVGTRAQLYRTLRETAAGGDRAVLFTSSEPEEVVRLAQRAIVLDRGRIVGELTGPEITEEALMLHAEAGHE